MFATYKKHNNALYNNLVKLSRNKFFYKEAFLDDKIENRVLLIFFHFAIILQSSKGQNKDKDAQGVFDNIFQNIEYSFTELGDGDVAVNKKMKNLSRIFYDILLNFKTDQKEAPNKNIYLLEKYFFIKEKKSRVNISKLSDYFTIFGNFCFDLDIENMLKGSFNFIYK